MPTLLVAAAIGLVIGLALGALGGGGGVLTVPALVYLLGVPAHDASTASLVIVGFAALVGLPAHALAGNVQWAAGLTFGVVGTTAALAGTALARLLDADVLLLVFALVIAVSAALMIRDAVVCRRRGPTRQPEDDDTSGGQSAASRLAVVDAPAAVQTIEAPPATKTATAPSAGHRSRRRQAMLIVLGGLAVGLLTGLFGVGGGFLAVPLLVLIMRWPMCTAVGTSLLVIVINTAASLVARIGTATVAWHVVVPVGVAAVIGTLAGKLVTDRVAGHSLSTAFGGTLVLLALYTGTRSALGLLS